ncbi:MAG: hypothetical protein V4544_04705 [Pseudomonadota bacterium]
MKLNFLKYSAYALLAILSIIDSPWAMDPEDSTNGYKLKRTTHVMLKRKEGNNTSSQSQNSQEDYVRTNSTQTKYKAILADSESTPIQQQNNNKRTKHVLFGSEIYQKYMPNNNWSNVDALERERKMLIRSKESFEPENEANLEKNKKIDAEIIKLDKEIATERNRITCKIAEINTIPKVKNSEWNTLSELNSSLALQTFQNDLKEIKKNLNVAKGKIQEEILPKWASKNGAKYSPSQKNSIRRIGKIINQINENYYLQSTRKEIFQRNQYRQIKITISFMQYI